MCCMFGSVLCVNLLEGNMTTKTCSNFVLERVAQYGIIYYRVPLVKLNRSSGGQKMSFGSSCCKHYFIVHIGFCGKQKSSLRESVTHKRVFSSIIRWPPKLNWLHVSRYTINSDVSVGGRVEN